MTFFFRGRCAVFFSIAYAAAVYFEDVWVAALSPAASARFCLTRLRWATANECRLVAAAAFDRTVQ